MSPDFVQILEKPPLKITFSHISGDKPLYEIKISKLSKIFNNITITISSQQNGIKVSDITPCKNRNRNKFTLKSEEPEATVIIEMEMYDNYPTIGERNIIIVAHDADKKHPDNYLGRKFLYPRTLHGGDEHHPEKNNYEFTTIPNPI